MSSNTRAVSFTPSSIILNGEMMDAREVKINPFSPSFQYGLNVFEGVRGYIDKEGHCRPFLLNEHLDRLESSARLMRLGNGLDTDRLKDDVETLLAQEPPSDDIYLKIMVFTNADASWSYTGNIDTFVFYYELKSSIRVEFPSEVKGKFCSFRRIDANVMPPRVKAGPNYINSRLGFLEVNPPESKSESCFPLFFNSSGRVSESSGACLFFAKDGGLVTPGLSSSILPSITRRHLLDHFDGGGKELKVLESDVDRWDLYDADEVFVCGTNVEVAAMVEIDGYRIGDGRPGPCTLQAFDYLKTCAL